MREQLEKFLAKAEDAHTKNQAVYHKAMKERAKSDDKVRLACTAASKTANEVAALGEALKKLPANDEEA